MAIILVIYIPHTSSSNTLLTNLDLLRHLLNILPPSLLLCISHFFSAGSKSHSHTVELAYNNDIILEALLNSVTSLLYAPTILAAAPILFPILSLHDPSSLNMTAKYFSVCISSTYTPPTAMSHVPNPPLCTIATPCSTIYNFIIIYICIHNDSIHTWKKPCINGGEAIQGDKSKEAVLPLRKGGAEEVTVQPCISMYSIEFASDHGKGNITYIVVVVWYLSKHDYKC